MCGRFVQRPLFGPSLQAVVDLEHDLGEIPASYNIAPTQRATVILDRGAGRQVTRMAWGLLPSWAREKRLQGSTINARIETVATKPAFRDAFSKRRCIVPMAGYYEWSTSDIDGKKDPWFVHADGPLWAAGLWEGPSSLLPADYLGTFSIITGDSSGVAADVHDRMPAWLQPAYFDTWLYASPEVAMASLLASSPSPIAAYRVSRAVNSPKNNGKQLLRAVA